MPSHVLASIYRILVSKKVQEDFEIFPFSANTTPHSLHSFSSFPFLPAFRTVTSNPLFALLIYLLFAVNHVQCMQKRPCLAVKSPPRYSINYSYTIYKTVNSLLIASTIHGIGIRAKMAPRVIAIKESKCRCEVVRSTG